MKLKFLLKIFAVIVCLLIGTGMFRKGLYISLVLWITAFSVILAENSKLLDSMKRWHKGIIFAVLVIGSFAFL
jgi:hypothetical protein